MATTGKSDLSICLAGEAGQGIQSIESILVALAKRAGYHVFATKEYMSRVRGGVNSTSIRISREPVSSIIDRADLVIPFSRESVDHIRDRIGPATALLADASALGITEGIDLPLSKIAAGIGSPLYLNTVTAGVIAGILGIDQSLTLAFVAERFAAKGGDVSAKNVAAATAGHAIGLTLAPRFPLEKPERAHDNVTLSGADAIALGALAGGCDYVCGYPMSPATGVLERLAKYSLTHDIVAEQVEDEVGVINMALGAWYAGARAFVTTSGGGFALMCEGISLAGMIETPVVLHLAQRPGPATGLPTRTEQGDLNLVLYAGHGDFPRLILAPGTLEEGFSLTAKAFDLADRFQVPSFVLTDQYYVDSYYDVPPFPTGEIVNKKHIVRTDPAYKRYAYAESGISPRGIPGFGDGIVCADSDEHSEGGYIVEDAETRVLMTDKRMKKGEALAREFIAPTRIGPAGAKKIVVCWGSTFPMARDAVAALGDESVALLHFSWLYPLPDLSPYFAGSERVVVVENNVTGQFADLLAREAGIRAAERVLKYDGRPFTVEELGKRLALALG